MTNTTRPVKRQPANVLCAVCGQPVATCTVGGLHGQVRDKAARYAASKSR